MIIITESEFREVFIRELQEAPYADYVTGPGRSGAIAAVYASHYLGIPFVPYKHKIEGARPLIVDTASESGRTIKKASKYYDDAPFIFAYMEPPRVKFWYEELSISRGRGNEYGYKNYNLAETAII